MDLRLRIALPNVQAGAVLTRQADGTYATAGFGCAQSYIDAHPESIEIAADVVEGLTYWYVSDAGAVVSAVYATRGEHPARRAYGNLFATDALARAAQASIAAVLLASRKDVR